jgi:hypothetical protein
MKRKEETLPPPLLSLDGAVVDLSVFSARTSLSVAEALRDGGAGRVDTDSERSGRSGLVVECDGEVAAEEFKETSPLVASFVLNILVNRFVIDGFSGAVWAGVGFCGSDGGAAWPLGGSSLVGILRPF